MSDNALIAPRSDAGPSAWAGVWIAEDIELIAHGVRSGSWIDGTLGVAAAGLTGSPWCPTRWVRCCSTASPG